MWVRDYRSPPKALALFQVYHRFAPLTDFSGPIWRIQVEEDACMQCYLLRGQSLGSSLEVRRGPTLAVQPPLLRIEGQLESLFPQELPIQGWIAQGTRWWLRNIGSVLVDKPMRLDLLNGLLEMDRAAYPELEAAIAYHPIVPLRDGSWRSLEELRKYARVFVGEALPDRPQSGWHEGYPVVQKGGWAKPLQALLTQTLEPLEAPPRWEATILKAEEWVPEPPEAREPERPKKLTQLRCTLRSPRGPMQVRFLKNRGDSSRLTVTHGNQRLLHRYWGVWEHWPICLDIQLSLTDRPPQVTEDHYQEWRDCVRQTLLKEAETLLQLLNSYPQALPQVCSLVGAMLEAKLPPPGWIWDFRDSEGRILAELVRARPKTLHPNHPLTRVQKLLGVEVQE